MKLSISLKSRVFALLVCLSSLLCTLTACGRNPAIKEYFSEYRSNLFLAETDAFSLRAYALKKEHPFVADGMVGEMTSRVEIYISAEGGSEPCKIAFKVGSVEYGGEASYDSVKKEYFYSCAADLSNLSLFPISVELGGTVYELSAYSVKTEKTMRGEDVVKILQESEQEFFSSLSDRNGLNAELHVRLLYEDAPYYYIGVVEKSGKRTAFLLDGETGKLLAKREA